MSKRLFAEWQDQYNLGIPLIDEQHRGIVSGINSFQYFLNSKFGMDECRKALSLMTDYTDLHLRTEEMLMLESNYPGHDEHVDKHRELVKQTNAFIKKSDIEKDQEQVLLFLKNIWFDHMVKEDRQYIKHMINNRSELGVGNNLFIMWQEQSNSGIDIVDEQHRGIVSCINSLHFFLQHNHGLESCRPILKLLSDYTEVHFKTEEKILFESKYPLYEEHVERHKELAKSTRTKWHECSVQHDPGQVLLLLKEWWLGHIGKEILEFSKYGVGTE